MFNVATTLRLMFKGDPTYHTFDELVCDVCGCSCLYSQTERQRKAADQGGSKPIKYAVQSSGKGAPKVGEKRKKGKCNECHKKIAKE